MLARPSGAFPAYIRDTLLGSTRKPELFNRRRLEPWLGEVLAGRRQGVMQAWVLVSLALWWDRFL
jgi:hypothetical protein